ncbi:FAD-linked sulfhydryl oxidase ERV1 isoform X3 [Benincasa hispida]|uniref:FAD-linked sulfhydryl oxidase ERV1 isoform X3 n=1 Tax=Benincasa hispida TaxID=102211 RepID=UPI001902A512|nr:FAD-linked sulfhydryl oxidase ERV1 isoform X3 [Benincasa hispida]
MSENPMQALFQTAQKISTSIQTHLSNLLSQSPHHSRPNHKPLSSPFSSSYATPSYTDTTYLQSSDIIHKPAAPVTKEALGRATWTFLHILAAQIVTYFVPLQLFESRTVKDSLEKGLRFWKSYPDHPTRQQKKDVKELVGYPFYNMCRWQYYLACTLVENVRTTLKKF